MTTKEALEAIFKQPTITPEQLLASGVMPVSRNSIYEALSKGEVENFRIGRKIIIPTMPLRQKLGLSYEKPIS